MKNQILNNLEYLFKESQAFVKNATIEEIISNYINMMNQYYLSVGISHYLEDEEPVQLYKLKDNEELKASFKQALALEVDEYIIIEKFKSDLKNAFLEIKSNVQAKNAQIKNQVIFLEYDFQPVASLLGYGKGDYPILETPKYLDSYPNEEIYSAFQKIDYRPVLENLIQFEEVVEQLEIEEYILESEFYLALRSAYLLKTYILLHKAFYELGTNLFEGIEVEKPVMVYANEHDCEQISIYALE